MFSKGQGNGNFEGLTQNELDGIKTELSLYLNERALQSGQPATANPKLRYLLQLKDRVEILSLRREALSDHERMRALFKEIVEPYLAIYLDENKAGYLGGSAKGKTLVFMDYLISKEIIRRLPKVKEEKRMEDERQIMRAIGSVDETRNQAVDYLFKRAITDGFGENNSKLFDNAASRVPMMGVEARKRWNQLVEGSLQALPESQRDQLKIGENKEKFNFEKVFSALSSDKGKRELIVSSQGLDVLIKELRSQYDKLKAEMKGTAPAARSQSLTGGALQIETLIQRLEGLRDNTQHAALNQESYQAVAQVFLNLFLNDHNMGSWSVAKGPGLQALEAALQQYNLKTASKQFVGDKTESLENSFLSAYSQYSARTKQAIIATLFKQTLDGAFGYVADQSPERMEKKKVIFTQALKAMDVMGEEAVANWNALAVTINQGQSNSIDSVLPFPDLVVNSENRSQAEATKTFEELSGNKEFMGFINRDVVTSLSAKILMGEQKRSGL